MVFIPPPGGFSKRLKAAKNKKRNSLSTPSRPSAEDETERALLVVNTVGFVFNGVCKYLSFFSLGLFLIPGGAGASGDGK